MKATHLSVGLYDQSWRRPSPTTRKREKHLTRCGTICDHTKATTIGAQVTCKKCLRKIGV